MNITVFDTNIKILLNMYAHIYSFMYELVKI